MILVHSMLDCVVGITRETQILTCEISASLADPPSCQHVCCDVPSSRVARLKQCEQARVICRVSLALWVTAKFHIAI